MVFLRFQSGLNTSSVLIDAENQLVEILFRVHGIDYDSRHLGILLAGIVETRNDYFALSQMVVQAMVCCAKNRVIGQVIEQFGSFQLIQKIPDVRPQLFQLMSSNFLRSNKGIEECGIGR